MKYPLLFSPIRIGNVEIRNRVVMTAMGCSLANYDGTPSDEIIAYYVARARGGVGLIINEVTRVDDETGVTEVRQLSVTKDENIPGLKKLTDAVHAEGAKIFCQLHHPGRQTYTAFTGIDAVVSASDQPCGLCQQPTRALTVDEVHAMVERFVSGAARAQAAGYDGVELHAAHGYLLEQFLSPYTNHRIDEYGGTLKNRMRIVNEIIEGIQARCGKAYPICVRFDADEMLTAAGIPAIGIEQDEAIAMAKVWEDMGVAALNVTVGMYETANTVVEPNHYAEGWRSHYVKAVKEQVGIPVMGNAVIRHPDFAEKLLEDDVQDMISMGRMHLADPEWTKKTMEGRECEIRKCISCLYCFETVLGALATGDPIKCAVNPLTGHELTYGNQFKQDGAGRTVAVIGAGAAGMEAARILALRGFRPIVFEAQDRVGGQLNVADKPPMKSRLTELTQAMECQLKALGVDVRLNTPATVEALKEVNPFAVILASGGIPIVPRGIEGIDSSNVYLSEDVLSGKADLSGKKIVVVGGRSNGLETAEFLAAKGCDVTVIEMLPEIGQGVYFQNLIDLTSSLARLEVPCLPNRQLVAIKANAVVTRDAQTGETIEMPADAVVLSVGTRSNNALAEALNAAFDKVIVVGDAGSVGRIGDATRSGFEAALAV